MWILEMLKSCLSFSRNMLDFLCRDDVFPWAMTLLFLILVLVSFKVRKIEARAILDCALDLEKDDTKL